MPGKTPVSDDHQQASHRRLRTPQETCRQREAGAVGRGSRDRRDAAGRRSQAARVVPPRLPRVLRNVPGRPVPAGVVTGPPDGDRQDRGGGPAGRVVRVRDAARVGQDDAVGGGLPVGHAVRPPAVHRVGRCRPDDRECHGRQPEGPDREQRHVGRGLPGGLLPGAVFGPHCPAGEGADVPGHANRNAVGGRPDHAAVD